MQSYSSHIIYYMTHAAESVDSAVNEIACSIYKKCVPVFMVSCFGSMLSEFL